MVEVVRTIMYKGIEIQKLKRANFSAYQAYIGDRKILTIQLNQVKTTIDRILNGLER